ncbi:MAG: Histone-like protein [uncultured bacterium]|nr:MAG: Histone-like protein [uncultured bacterium]OFW70083.1 MAG: DNA-binding protein [Alphaproteobacteria bacterium GWC2_42_16]OFW74583.1 MAG: DNA-binding protein [Alphaproteobacteria bacterium GWA2_41_27]OFW84855.1 MAG: DNA-binding protein [Alphaproteobacteria bacterium RIFCSPHIGHO2_12_FULL_42_100]OFW86580.1 MAG: DNA-binding protein [Alphaproteobacteria bacterium RBG_16_42_14]OFW90973.1 MAG: DNA-binding protein [Alphaproteobacteria bacterium RIFCSPHIGHO2_12_42_13]OFW92874.1 MAG: DNA-bindin
MTKSELIAMVAKKAGLKNKEASKAVEGVLESIVRTVAKGNDVRLVGFGTFTLAKRAARNGRNPRTGAPLKIPAMKVPRFRAGKEFKKAVS